MRKLLKGLAWTFGILAVIVLVLRIFVIKWWTIPTEPWLDASMGPTLRSGDFVILITRGDREFGDLVRCTDPEDPNSWVVGRIGGVAGDRVQVDKGTLVVNGRRYGTTEACREDMFAVKDPSSGAPANIRCARVEMGGGWHYVGMGKNAGADEGQEFTVGAGRVFLVSDDREFSRDSRDFGAVPAETCTERITFRLWGADGFFKSPTRFDAIR
ncbi:MAG: signal peptidase I [Polyangiaceae bacterium]